MDWSEIKIDIPCEYTDTAAAIANMTVPYGIYIEDYSDMDELLPQTGIVDYVDDELQNKDRTRAVIHVYIPKNLAPAEAVSFIEQRLSAENIPYSVTSADTDDSQWAENWKKYYHPERIGKRLVICPSWESFEKKPDDVVLTLDPGSSFGTGKHETTRLCLETLDSLIGGGERVLDMGCGTGILSLAALLLGARSAKAVDIDKNAAHTAEENAVQNGVGENYDACFGDVVSNAEFRASLGSGYDVICANIVADVIIAMREIFLEKLADDGTLIVSGIIDTRSDEVLLALANAGFVVAKKHELNGWVAAECKKSGSEKA